MLPSLAILCFYEILFLDFFSTCSQLQKNNENARNKEIMFYLFNVTEKHSTVTHTTPDILISSAVIHKERDTTDNYEKYILQNVCCKISNHMSINHGILTK